MISKHILSLITLTFGCISAFAAERAATYRDALVQAKRTGADICVYFHGSDWNKLGEALKKEIWDRPELVGKLGRDIILLAVDHREKAPNYVLKNNMAELCKTLPPLHPLESVTAKGTTYTKQKDNSWFINLKRIPHRTTATITFKTAAMPVSAVVVSLLTDKRLTKNGPGVSGGVFSVSEIECFKSGQTTPLTIKAAAANLGNSSLMKAFNGKPEYHAYWSGDSRKNHVDHHVVIIPQKPFPANSTMEVKVHFTGKPWDQLGAKLGLRLIKKNERTELLAETERLHSHYGITMKNGGIPVGINNYPAIALLDPNGLPIGKVERLRKEITINEVAERVEALREKRRKRDNLWAQAETAQGVKKAELLAQGLDVVGFYHKTRGHEKVYQKRFDEILKLDPKKTAPHVRKLAFNPGETSKKADELLKAGKAVEALSLIDSELAKKPLRESHQLSLLLKKFQICRDPKNKVPDGKKWKVLDAMVAINPESREGIGAQGYPLMHGKGPVTLTFGWRPEHLKTGKNTWTIDFDTEKYLWHSGPYDFTMNLDRKAKHGITIKQVEFISEGTVIFSEAINKDLTKANPGITTHIDLSQLPKGSKAIMKLTVEANEGTESKGKFKFVPKLPPPPTD